MKARALTISAVIAALVTALAILAMVFGGFLEPVEISAHGYFAFGLATILCLAVSVGLFALLFHSARSGQDDISDYQDNPN